MSEAYIRIFVDLIGLECRIEMRNQHKPNLKHTFLSNEFLFFVCE